MKKIISIITILTLFLSQSQFVLAQDAPLDKETEIQQFAKEQGISKEQATIYVDYILTRKLNDYQQKLYDRASPRIKAMMEGKSSAYGSKIISLLENTAGSVLKKNIDYFIVLSSLADFTSQLNLNGFIKDFETKLDYVHYQNIPNFDSEAGISDKNILLTNPNEPDI